MPPPQPDPLLRAVKRTNATRRMADAEYRAALQAARAAGRTYSAIAEAAGSSRQAVRQLIERATHQP